MIASFSMTREHDYPIGGYLCEGAFDDGRDFSLLVDIRLCDLSPLPPEATCRKYVERELA